MSDYELENELNHLPDDYDPANDPNANPYDHPQLHRRGIYTSGQLRSMEERFVDPAIDKSENELHAGIGQVCPVCHRAIAAGDAIRLRVDGTYQHDAC